MKKPFRETVRLIVAHLGVYEGMLDGSVGENLIVTLGVHKDQSGGTVEITPEELERLDGSRHGEAALRLLARQVLSQHDDGPGKPSEDQFERWLRGCFPGPEWD